MVKQVELQFNSKSEAEAGYVEQRRLQWAVSLPWFSDRTGRWTVTKSLQAGAPLPKGFRFPSTY